MSFQELLSELGACSQAKEWAKDKTWEEVYNTCERGDWLCWLFARTNPDDLKLLTLVKGHQANLVRHLMTDERSLKAVDTAIAFGEGRATIEQLSAAAYAAYAAADAADAAYAAYAAADAAGTAYAAYAAADAAGTDDDDDARVGTLRKCADIVRQYIPIKLWNVEK